MTNIASATKRKTTKRVVDEIGSRIETLRKRRGLTQKALGDMAGASQQQINRWEAGEIEMKATSLAKVAKALRVSADFILGL